MLNVLLVLLYVLYNILIILCTTLHGFLSKVSLFKIPWEGNEAASYKEILIEY